MKSLLAAVFLASLTGCSIQMTNTERADGETTSSARQALSCAPDDGLWDSALTVCNDLSGAGEIAIDGDLSVGGELSHAGEFDVSGAVHHVAPACGSRGFDVATAVARARDDHDHEAASVLDDGRYYFADASFVGENHIEVVGHASMFVDGDLDFVGESSIFVRPGASLDLYVAGSVSAVGNLVAAGCAPDSLRVYVGGHGSIIAGAGESELRGFLYAPDAEVSLAGETHVMGAVVAKELSFAGELRVDGVAAKKRPASSCGRVPAAPEVTPN